MTDVNIPSTRKISILSQQLEVWRNTLYAAQINYEIGELLNNQSMMEAEKTNMAGALSAIKFICSKLTELGAIPPTTPEDQTAEEEAGALTQS